MANQFLGNALDWLGTFSQLPEYGYSEGLAGGPTTNTGVTQSSQDAGYVPYSPANYSPNVPTNIYQGSTLGATTTASPQGTGGGGDPTNNVVNDPVNNDPNPGPSGPSLQEQQRNQIFGMLDGLVPGLDALGASGATEIGSLYDTNLGRVNEAGASQQEKLLGLRGDARANQSSTLKDVATDFRNALQAGRTYLGGIGAGTSSATGRLTGALAKGANRRKTDVVNQFSKIMSDIDLKGVDIQDTVNNQVAELDIWKTTQLGDLTRWVQTQKNNIAQQKIEVQQGMNDQVMQAAMNELANIQNRSASYQNAIAQWGAERATNLTQFKASLQDAAQYQAPGVGYNAFNTGIFNAPSSISRQFIGSAGSDEEQQN